MRGQGAGIRRTGGDYEMELQTQGLPGLLLQAERTYRRQQGEGKTASYIPELANVPPDLFSVSATTLSGVTYSAGDSRTLFSMQSISKVVALAFVIERLGDRAVFSRVGMEPCAEPFNSIAKLELASNIPLNPFINAGAISVASMIARRYGERALEEVLDFASLLSFRPQAEPPRPFSVNWEIYGSEAGTADRNRSLAYFMHSTGALSHDVDETLALYFQLCSVEATTEDLSSIGATIASGGVNPVTGARVISIDTAHTLLGLMSTCGLYDGSGEFAVNVGVPAKSGVCGGVLCAVPGRMGLAVFSPPLNARGNSVAGLKTLAYISRRLKLRGI